ncbi:MULTISPECIES: helix-turn-helix domain-containing protein [Lactobacillus]|uniref:helix-turn-helix domain-containing protein n=1 Tax=Lactobacillus TaxID=1578 RepID=UPI001F17C858|nr:MULTISPECIES: helix-turn-helix domain-containing protein [Lactobacillus]
MIKQLTGYSFAELHLQCRLEAAKHLLNTTDYVISEICEIIGLHNQNTFYRKFKQYCHLMPGEYRRQHRDQEKGSSLSDF